MRTYRRITRAGLFSVLFGLGLLVPAAARALDLTAGTATELADAIARVNAETAIGTHSITLTANIALTASPPVIDNATAGVEIVIDGGGFTVDGRNRPNLRSVTIAAGIVEIQNITLTGGNIDFGGGIYNDGTLTMTNCTVSGNNAGVGGGIYNDGTLTMTHCTVNGNAGEDGSGGGILNHGPLTMTHCTVSGNTAVNGGGINNNGSNNTGGTLTMTNCTVSGNYASNYFGGGIVNTGPLTMTHCTVSGNSSSEEGGGIVSWGAPLTMTATIVAGNAAPSSPDVLDFDTINSGGYNLIGNGSGSFGFTGTNDQVGGAGRGRMIDPLLGPLADNGGSTLTHALLPDSPAIDAILAGDCAVATDQRGIDRPSGGACDIGAFEAQVDLLPGDPVPLTCAADADTYIFPLAENCPLTSFSLEASEALTLNGVIATYTGVGPVPTAMLVANEGGQHTVHLNPPPTPGEWLRLDMNVTSTGTGLTADLTVFVAHQPLDFNCDGRSDLQDATAFGAAAAEFDLNCDGAINVQDATAFGNIWQGEAPATRAWGNTSLPPKP